MAKLCWTGERSGRLSLKRSCPSWICSAAGGWRAARAQCGPSGSSAAWATTSSLWARSTSEETSTSTSSSLVSDWLISVNMTNQSDTCQLCRFFVHYGGKKNGCPVKNDLTLQQNSILKYAFQETWGSQNWGSKYIIWQFPHCQTPSSSPHTAWNHGTWAFRSCGLDLTPDLGQFWFIWVTLGWHATMLRLACGSDWANRSGPPPDKWCSIWALNGSDFEEIWKIEVDIVSYHGSHRLALNRWRAGKREVWVFDLCSCISYHKYLCIMDKVVCLDRHRPSTGARQTWQSKLNMSLVDSSGHQRRNWRVLCYTESSISKSGRGRRNYNLQTPQVSSHEGTKWEGQWVPPPNLSHNSGSDIAEHFNNIVLLRLAVDNCLTT